MKEKIRITDALKSIKNGNYTEAVEIYKEILSQYPEKIGGLKFLLRYATLKSKGIKLTNDPQTNNTYEKNEKIEFDSEYYLRNNIDVRQSGMSPEVHYWNFGESEGRKPNEHFDPKEYLRLNADVRIKKISPFGHYLSNGYKENRINKNKSCAKNKQKKHKKAILFVGHDSLPGGAQIVLLEIVKWFSENMPYRIKVLLLAPGSLSTEYDKYADVYVLPKRDTVDEKDVFAEFIKDNLLYVYINTVVSGLFFKLLNEEEIEINTKFVSHIHESEKILEENEKELELIKKHSQYVITAAKNAGEILIKKYNFEKERVKHLPAFISPIQYDPANRIMARADLNISLETMLVMGCGSVYWAKGVDIFISTARKVNFERKGDNRIIFIWVGGGIDLEKYKKELTEDESSYIKLIGQKTNSAFLLSAADLFYLSSRQDSFPLVVLEAAQHEVPSICFKPATGITEFIREDTGYPLDEIEANGAATKIQEIFSGSKEDLKTRGENARKLLHEKYATNRRCLELIVEIRDKLKIPPSISVIVPFFNHEKYAAERIESIIKQKFKDIQIILLDDDSADGTLNILERYLIDPRIELHKSVKNSGSPFKQWKKGLKYTKAELVWIAEGDDSCSPNFMEVLYPYFEDQLINIAVAKTSKIDENGVVDDFAFLEYQNEVYPNRYSSSFEALGIEEICKYYAAHQTIVNASGVILRVRPIIKAINLAQDYKLCGDWIVYLSALQNGKIIYDTRTTNYFRRHSKSQIATKSGGKLYFEEREKIINHVTHILENIPNRTVAKAWGQLKKEWDKINIDKSCDYKFKLYNNLDLLNNSNSHRIQKKARNILIVISAFAVGGGEIFSIRLANALKKIGHNIVLLSVNSSPPSESVYSMLEEGIPVFDAESIKFDELVKAFNVDLVHSSIWWADKYVYKNIHLLSDQVKWVITMHGCYENLLHLPVIDGEYKTVFSEMLNQVNGWVYIAEKNLEIFNYYKKPNKIRKISNGYDPISPKSIMIDGLRPHSLKIALVSRAIEEKGWRIAVDCVMRMNKFGFTTDLLLVGGGPLYDEFSKSNVPDYIKLVGQVPNVQDYIGICDLGILPSYFRSESMPLSIIEFMAQGKPIVASDIGEIKNMTQDAIGKASIIVNLINEHTRVDDFYAALVKLHVDRNLLSDLAAHSTRKFKDFTMEKMIAEYTKYYDELFAFDQ